MPDLTRAEINAVLVEIRALANRCISTSLAEADAADDVANPTGVIPSDVGVVACDPPTPDTPTSPNVEEALLGLALEACALLGLPHKVDDPGLPTHGQECWKVIADQFRRTLAAQPERVGVPENVRAAFIALHIAHAELHHDWPYPRPYETKGGEVVAAFFRAYDHFYRAGRAFILAQPERAVEPPDAELVADKAIVDWLETLVQVGDDHGNNPMVWADVILPDTPDGDGTLRAAFALRAAGEPTDGD